MEVTGFETVVGMFSGRTYFSPENLAIIYEAFIRPLLEYNSH